MISKSRTLDTPVAGPSVSSRIRIGYMHWIALINQTHIRISEYAWIKTHTCTQIMDQKSTVTVIKVATC